MAENVRPRRVLVLNAMVDHPISLGTIEYARQSGWSMMFAAQESMSAAAVARRWECDGVIVSGEPNEKDRRAWQRSHIPLVWLGDRTVHPFKAARVLLNFRASGRLAAQHFIDAGFRHLAYCWLGNWWPLNHQFEGFRQTSDSAGATVHTLDWSAAAGKSPGSFSETFRRWLRKQVSALPRPLGLMMESDWTALEALAALRDGGILVPDEVAVVSCYNIAPICEGAIVPLSSVDMNAREQGYQAAALLGRLMQGEAIPDEPVWVAPKGVVVRQSSNVLAVPHAGVATAMHLIRTDFRNPELTVERLAGAAGISTVALGKAFRKHLGQSPGERLRQWRLREAMTLLTTTRRTAKDIAAACGYGTISQFIRCVKTATGQSPAAWRKNRQV
ncbi:MAG: substrate-binding domain-containing protein [Planctomycetaceae bacterium]|nr:substrate-binding domain-containing protein [Planctomycetaceae bacterium]